MAKPSPFLLTAMGKFLPIFRLAALSAVVIFSLIVLGLSAHLVYFTTTFFSAYFTYSAMAIATAVLTIMTAPVMLVIDMMRKGAFTSMVLVEVAWLGVLWVLWLTSAALAANANTFTFISGCDYVFPELSAACKEGNAIEAFSFLCWLILMGYWGTLLVFALMSAQRGNGGVWNASVSAIAEGNTNAPTEKSEFAPGVMAASHPTGETASYPPSQQTSGWVGEQQQQPSYHPQV